MSDPHNDFDKWDGAMRALELRAAQAEQQRDRALAALDLAMSALPDSETAGNRLPPCARRRGRMPDVFGSEQLQAAIDAELAAVPDGHRGALVAWYTTDGRYRVSVATRIGEGWSLGALFEGDQKAGRVAGGVYVRGSW